MTDRSHWPAIHLHVPVGGRPGSDAHSVIELARRAEAAGFDGIVVVDHVVMGDHPEQYPLGRFAFAPDSPWIDPLITLAAVAAVTERIQLVTSILIAAVRAPGVLAKEVATIEQLAPGRLQLGVGTGWQREEFGVNRVDFADRGRLLDDTMRACRALWSDAPAALSTASVAFDRLWCEPRPANGGPPLLVGGQLTGPNKRRIVEWADGWIPHPESPTDVIHAGIQELRAVYGDAGRDPKSLHVDIMRSAADLAGTFALIGEFCDSGVTAVSIPLARFVDDRAQWDTWFDEAAAHLSAIDR